MKKKSNHTIIESVTVLIVLGIIIFLFAKYNHKAPVVEEQNTPTPSSSSAVTISTMKINENNFTGTRIIIQGKSKVATLAQNYVDQTVADFKKTADTDVPPMRQEFGADGAQATYSIDFVGKYVKSDNTESIIVSDYVYTGGANGMTIYKVFTVSKKDGTLLPLSSVIKPSEQDAFTAYVKKKLIDWRPEGSDATVVFPDDVNNLTFLSFADWSLDNTNLIIYFDQNAIAPSATGAIAFPIPLSSIQNYFVEPK